MDMGSVILIAQGLNAQRLESAKLEHTIHHVKKHQDLQQSVMSQLLASMPGGTNPDGVGGNVDLSA